MTIEEIFQAIYGKVVRKNNIREKQVEHMRVLFFIAFKEGSTQTLHAIKTKNLHQFDAQIEQWNDECRMLGLQNMIKGKNDAAH